MTFSSKAPVCLRACSCAALAAVLAWLSGCSTPPGPVVVRPAPAPAPPAPVVVTRPAPEPEPVQPRVEPAPENVASAGTPREYRRYGASHIYRHNAHRVYAGKLPPMLYAVGVLNVDIDARGQVQRLDWMRAPRHAPEVVAEIERMVRAAAPYPAPVRMGRKSGRFQLDTLTEGQD